MLKTRPRSSPTAAADAAADALREGMARARDMLESMAVSVGDAVESADFDIDELGTRVRRIARAIERDEPDCAVPVEDATDRERLKAALVAGVVVFLLSAFAFLVARRIVERWGSRRDRRPHRPSEAASDTTGTPESAETPESSPSPASARSPEPAGPIA